uniref:Filamentous hemagglutinin-like protein n=1 Tax=Chlorobium chlorochromatii (strain CaD3) TaxID=340177 RepID=Q3AQF8_CHLCH
MKTHPLFFPLHGRDVFVVALCVTQLLLVVPQAQALPTGGAVVAGSANVTLPSATTMQIEQASQKAIINWQSFGAERGERVQIVQPESSSVLLNRVIGNNPTSFFGQLQANGQVFLVNPNGIYFAPTSQLNTGGLVASTLSLNDRDFLAGNYAFVAQGAMGALLNEGTLQGGFVALLGSNVENRGAIVTTRGTAALAAGEAMTLNLDASGLVALTVDQAAYNAHIRNSGILEAEGGTVVLNAGAAEDVLAGVVNNSGRVVATSVSERNGAIVIEGGSLVQTGEVVAPTINVAVNRMVDAGSWRAEQGNITIHAATTIEQTAASHISASGKQGGSVRLEAGKQLYLSGAIESNGTDGQSGSGGTIAVTSPTTTIAGATLSANGGTDGGMVLIGGGWQGSEPNLPNAATTTVTASSSISANASTVGNGGTVVVWSEQATTFAGTIAANGGSESGNGGAVEVSGHEQLAMSGTVSTSAHHGEAGFLLLDPRNITIEQPLLLSQFQFQLISLLDPNATAGNQHGSGAILELLNGNLLVTSPLDDVGGSDAGALRLYRPDGTLLSTLTGSATGDLSGGTITPLQGNSNAVFLASNWSNGTAAKAGAVTWIDGTNGVSGTISEGNSFVGTHANDGMDAEVIALSNGNYVAHLPSWQHDEVLNAGAVAFGNGTSGSAGTISEANSLVGTKANDSDSAKVVALTNGNYVVASPLWDNGSTTNVGAVTWGNGQTGKVGAISGSNSLIGTKSGDNVGLQVTSLANGNYVIGSPNWDNGSTANVGAVTWADGNLSIHGALSATNSLVGAKSGDYVGSSVTALTNSNYVVVSQSWSSDTATDVGAVTLGHGDAGTTGVVTADNSLVGSSTGDGEKLSATALANGNFVVVAPKWDGDATNMDVGAVVLGNGVTGSVGQISATNALVGTTANDLESATVTPLTNGNYVVAATKWDNGVVADAGAVIVGSGTTSITGTISAANSLVGSVSNDLLSATITPLTNGNYVVAASKWDNGAVLDAGAVAWGNGQAGTVGSISESNSLVGNKKDDFSGLTITALHNGNYVVSASLWDNGSITNVGAVTWGNGQTGTVGTINSTNSLIGAKSGDKVGAVTVALSDGNYATASGECDNGSLANAGAVTFGNGGGGTVGVVSSANSVMGSEKDGKIGSGGLTPLRVGSVSGGVVVSSPLAQASNGNVTLFAPSTANEAGMLSADYTYAADGSSNVTVTPTQLATLLNNGTSVRLQASNTITLNTLLTANASSSTTLELHAGKSILLNNSIVTGNGNLTLIANDSAEHGVDNTLRESGAAVISMASGTAINAGTGQVVVELRDGGERANNASGDITLGSVTAGTISVANNGSSNSSGVVLAGAALTANESNGSTIVLSGQHFTNSANATLNTEPEARWLIYSSSPEATQKGGLTSSFRSYNVLPATYAAAAVTEQGHGFLYASAPSQLGVNITLNNGSASSVYGNEPNATLGYSLHGFADNEESANTIGLEGSMQVSGMPNTTSSVGTYNVAYAGGLTSSKGFTFTAGTPLALTVEPQPITVNPDDQEKTYDDTDPDLTWQVEAQGVGRGLLVGDVFSGELGREAGEDVGSYAITLNTLHNDNYAISFIPGTFTITQRPLTLSATSTQKVYGEADPTLAVTITSGSLASTLRQDALSDVVGTLNREVGNNVGSYDVVLGSGSRSSNYNITFAADNNAFTIAQRPLTVTASPLTKTYGDADAALAWQAEAASSGRGLLANDTLHGELAREAGEDVGNYAILQHTLGNNNYAISYQGSNLSITQRSLTLSATPTQKVYGEADPTLAVTITSGSLASSSVQDALGDVTGLLSRQVGNNVGSYDLQLGSGSRASNYNITFTANNNAFTIMPRPVVVAANNFSKVYGDADPALTWQAESSDPALAAENLALLRSLELFNNTNNLSGITGAPSSNESLLSSTENNAQSSSDTASTSSTNNEDEEMVGIRSPMGNIYISFPLAEYDFKVEWCQGSHILHGTKPAFIASERL